MNPILNWVDNNFSIEIKQSSLIISQVPAGAQVIDGLLYKDELKNKQGKEQRNIVYQYLKSALLKEISMTLENKLDIMDSAELARTEEKMSKKKALELFESGYLDNLEAGTYKTLAEIHKYLFGEIYKFAGKLRNVNIVKSNF